MNENMKPIPPFKFFTMTNFPFIADDFDQMTNYAMFCKIVEYLNKVIKNSNTQNENINSLYNAFLELKNWFDNLDVQDEVNNKLDEMAESGELTEIIAQYLSLSGVFGFDKISDMANAENLIAGSICRTLGQNTYNDGKGAFYRVRTVTTSDVIDGVNIVAITHDNTLIAEKMPDFTINQILSDIDNIYNTPKNFGTLHLRRKFRILRKGHLHPEHVPNNVFSYLQGCCYTKNDKMIVTSYNTNDSDRVLLQEISLNTGEVLREQILALYHSNSICYNPTTNKLYVATLQINVNDEKVLLDTIIVIDYDSLTITNTIDLNLSENEGTFAISYDPVSNKTIVAIQRNDDTLRIYNLDLSDNSLDLLNFSEYYDVFSNGGFANVMIYNDIVYIMKHRPYEIYMYKASTLEYIGVFNLPRIDEANGYIIAENQALFCNWNTDNKDFYLCTNNLFSNKSWWHSYQFFICNPEKNIDTRVRRLDELSEKRRVIIVDASSTAINPDGSSSKPYNTIDEAIEALNTYGLLHARIELAEGTYSPATIITDKYFELTKESTADIDNVIIKGLYGSYGLKGHILDLTIDRNSQDIENLYNINFSRNSDIKFTGLKLVGTGTHINVGGNVIIKDIANYQGILFNFLSNTTVKCFDSEVDFNFEGYKPLILTPIKIASFTGISTTSQSVDVSKFHDILENDGTLYIRTHGNYDYKFIEVPFQKNMVNRIVTVIHNALNVKVIQLTHDATNDTLSAVLNNSFNINGNSGTFTNNKSSATEDFEIYYK